MTREVWINAALAAAWAALGVFGEVEWLVPVVGVGRLVIGWAATRLGRPIPVDH